MSRAESITRALGGAWTGKDGIARCPAHEDHTPSLSLKDGADGRLLAFCHAGCPFVLVADALRAQGLLPSNQNYARQSPAERTQRAKDAKAAKDRRAQLGRELWERAGPISSTLGERYIRERGITCSLPGSLRYIGDCWHKSGQHLPAIVARVEGCESFAVHRTYLKPDGRGKAAVDLPKVMLGSVKGGSVRLSRPSRRLAVAEGIETALSLRCGFLSAQTEVHAALSATGMRRFNLPPTPGELVLAPDGDPVGLAAAEYLAERAAKAGWHIAWLRPPSGMDWNDVLRERRGNQ
ncbi:toprim domain-containing protein [Boseongicola sp. H5]|uniref:DUF7146 domain-containing protein n=1 Tax=Boseongicola sp. H5 TaxID=2763261 RepID=UPI001D0A1156|nr:toprim domain-containing protein [Boseongicola sp. H5]